MTREEAHEKLHFGNKLGYLDFNELHIGIENIFDDFEEKLEQLQNKSCDGCKYEGTKVIDCLDCSRYYRDRYESKDNE